MLWIYLAIIAIALLYYFTVKPLKYWTKLGVKQGNPIPLFGDSWGMLWKKQSMADYVQYIYDQVPNVRYSGCYQFSLPNLLVKDPELIKQITVKDFDHFVDHRVLIPEEVDPLLGKNLFSLTGQRWRDMRATLSPSFTSSKMKFMFSLMADAAHDFVQHFKNKNEKIVTVEMKDTFTRYTNDVIATTAFGIKVDSLENRDNEFYLMGKEATDFSGVIKNLKFFGYMIVPWLFKIFSVSLFGKELSRFFRGLITDTIRTREEKHIVRNDMINLLMEARKGSINKQDDETTSVDTGFATVEESEVGKAKVQKHLTDEDITAQALIFFFAGFDTVASIMCFMAYELGVSQEIQDRLREEIEHTMKENKGKLTYESLLKMKYMDMVVTETLRKWPVAIGSDRICTKPYTIEPKTPEEKPVLLEKNTVISLPIFAIHRDPKFYPEPEKFDPERFSDKNKDKIVPYTYLPFGAGPRNCIGSRFAILEIKVLFYHILSNFKIVPVEKTTIPLKLSKKTFNLMSDGGFWFGLERLERGR
ncbi:unnamed protein product [Brassicogethes aeneus]|uniref:Cytochrome P450 n=1 Tax=Brassicogethes aeneus TaxID=1431903 RepID=A0A9P0BK19_BRAAE|nr:unnamed protein product [Brassicogethes aeneus]